MFLTWVGRSLAQVKRSCFFLVLGFAVLRATAAELPPSNTPEATVDSPADAAVSEIDEQDRQPDTDPESQEREIADKVNLRADEDPLARQQARQQIEKTQTEEAPERLPEAEKAADVIPYGSARLQYRYTNSHEQIWSGSGSRVGLKGYWSYQPGSSFFGLAEYGFDLLDEVDKLFNPSGTPSDRGATESVFPRLVYVGWEIPNNFLLVGKSWSAYYQVANWTDRMEATGGSALGVYNANTDGGPTGTGRADAVLQTRLNIDFLPDRWFEPFKINFQVQEGRPIPQTESLDYGYAMGASTILEFDNNYFVGLAANYAQVDDVGTPQARAVNLRGNAQAYVLGLRKFTEDWYVAFGAARLRNHETTDLGIYFDGWGGEFYTTRRVSEQIWLGGGVNLLKPDADQTEAQAYKIAYGLVELRYSFRGFDRTMFLNYRLEQGRLQAGTEMPDVLTFGVRWDFP